MAKTVNKKKTAAKSGKNTTAKTPAKKPVAKKAAAKPTKPVAKKPAPKKPVAQKPVAKSTAAIKTPVKSASAVKTAKPANDMTKAKQAAPKQAAVKQTATAIPATATKQAAKNDNANQIKNLEFKAGDKVVYPAHGVGRVEGIEKLVAAGIEVTLYTITFEKDRMRLKLPLQKVATSGLRPLANKDQLAEVYSTMKGRARIRRVMWSRRAQEYEAKINSGSPVQVAEVLRDLKRNVSSTEHSYSERQIFQQALERLASELAAIENVTQEAAAEKLQSLLVEA